MAEVKLSQKLEVTPEVADAIAHERLVRDVAFLPVTESIAGFEVLPINLEHLILLQLAGSPLLSGKLPSPAQLAQFLWVLNPAYHPQGGAARKRFLRQCRQFMPRPAPFFNFWIFRKRWLQQNAKHLARAAAVIDAAHAYVFEAFQDRPAHNKAAESRPEYYSDACYFCALFGREFGWTQAETLRTPLKRIFQYLKEIRQHYKPDAPLFNPSDKLLGDSLQKQAENSRSQLRKEGKP